MRTQTNAMVATRRLSLLLVAAYSQALLVGVAATSIGNPGATDFFVAVQGKDLWSGRPADLGENDRAVATAPRPRLAAGAYGKTGNRNDREPLFRFLQIADTHVYEGPPHATNHCALANEKMKWVVETVARGKHFPVPDFVIHSGDMIDGEPQAPA